MPNEYYKLLGVEPTATEEQIRRAYVRKSKEDHPDRVQGNMPANFSEEELGAAKKAKEEKFKALLAAYEVLSDPAKRRMYDAAGGELRNPGSNSNEFTPASPDMFNRKKPTTPKEKATQKADVQARVDKEKATPAATNIKEAQYHFVNVAQTTLMQLETANDFPEFNNPLDAKLYQILEKFFPTDLHMKSKQYSLSTSEAIELGRALDEYERNVNESKEVRQLPIGYRLIVARNEFMDRMNLLATEKREALEKTEQAASLPPSKNPQECKDQLINIAKCLLRQFQLESVLTALEPHNQKFIDTLAGIFNKAGAPEITSKNISSTDMQTLLSAIATRAIEAKADLAATQMGNLTHALWISDSSLYDRYTAYIALQFEKPSAYTKEVMPEKNKTQSPHTLGGHHLFTPKTSTQEATAESIINTIKAIIENDKGWLATVGDASKLPSGGLPVIKNYFKAIDNQQPPTPTEQCHALATAFKTVPNKERHPRVQEFYEILKELDTLNKQQDHLFKLMGIQTALETAAVRQRPR